jgi:hypothetical protein
LDRAEKFWTLEKLVGFTITIIARVFPALAAMRTGAATRVTAKLTGN